MPFVQNDGKDNFLKFAGGMMGIQYYHGISSEPKQYTSEGQEEYELNGIKCIHINKFFDNSVKSLEYLVANDEIKIVSSLCKENRKIRDYEYSGNNVSFNITLSRNFDSISNIKFVFKKDVMPEFKLMKLNVCGDIVDCHNLEYETSYNGNVIYTINRYNRNHQLNIVNKDIRAIIQVSYDKKHLENISITNNINDVELQWVGYMYDNGIRKTLNEHKEYDFVEKIINKDKIKMYLPYKQFHIIHHLIKI